MTGIDLKSLYGLTFRQPALAAQQVLAANLPMSIRWASALLVVSLAAILAWAVSGAVPTPDQGEQSLYGWMAHQPLMLAAIQLVALVLTAAIMTGVGSLFGGPGRFEDALILTVWIEAVLLSIQFMQLVLLMVMPGFAAILGVLSIVLFFYLLVQFTKVLHGFTSGWKVLLAIIATMFALGFLLSFMAAAFGLLPEVPA